MRNRLLIITIVLIVIVILPISFGLPKKEIVPMLEGDLREYVKTSALTVTEQDGLWTVETQIQNDTNDDITIDSFLFIVYDSERNEIFRTPLDLGTVLHAGEEKQISVTTLTNLETVTSCRYEIEGGVAE